MSSASPLRFRAGVPTASIRDRPTATFLDPIEARMSTKPFTATSQIASVEHLPEPILITLSDTALTVMTDLYKRLPLAKALRQMSLMLQLSVSGVQLPTAFVVHQRRTAPRQLGR